MESENLQRTPEQFAELIRRQQRGRLKIYLGFAAGVGKTYEMLQEAHRLKRQGVDVVIGIVETHKRAETQEQIGDLERPASEAGLDDDGIAQYPDSRRFGHPICPRPILRFAKVQPAKCRQMHGGVHDRNSG